MKVSWNMMLAVAREYGYSGPDTPTCHAELEELALALAEVDRADDGPGLLPGDGPGAYISRVLGRDTPIDVEGAGGSPR
jgi:hypothetical protein